VNSLDYFEAHQPSAADVDRMAAELTKTQERRGKYSRRRPHYEEQDIDHINSRNEVFNKKVKRAYDKYTAEIKANLERGTAL
jgi:predicted metal-dependent phosphoesterase TrpH